MYRKVDPAALLLAIFTVAFNPLTTEGPWGKMNTIVAGSLASNALVLLWFGRSLGRSPWAAALAEAVCAPSAPSPSVSVRSQNFGLTAHLAVTS